jgi:hypothetical protein
MGKIDIKQIGGLGSGNFTKAEYDNEATIDLVEHKLSKIRSIVDSLGNEYSTYIVGLGGQPKALYTEINGIAGMEVKWKSSTLSSGWKLLSPFIASYSGLVKVVTSENFEYVFLRTIEQSMAGVYIFPRSYEVEFENAVSSSSDCFEFDYGIKLFEDYFFYMVDADNYKSNTGIYEIVSIGTKANYIIDTF